MNEYDERPVSDERKFYWEVGDLKEVPLPGTAHEPVPGDEEVELFTPQERDALRNTKIEEEDELPQVGGACPTCLADPCECSSWGNDNA